MNMFANLQTDDTVEDEKDIVGGGGPWDSDIYPVKIEMAYLDKSSGGATFVHLQFTGENGRSLRQNWYMTSGAAKGAKNYYEKNGERRYLPGFINANALGLLTVGKEIAQLADSGEEKVINVYDPAQGQEVATKKHVLVDLLGREAYIGVLKQIEDKNAKGDDGEYHPTGETREANEVDKVFRLKDKMTTAEIRAKAEEATFFNTWREKNAGNVRDKTSKQSGNAGAPAAAGNNGGTAKPTESLFG